MERYIKVIEWTGIIIAVIIFCVTISEASRQDRTNDGNNTKITSSTASTVIFLDSDG